MKRNCIHKSGSVASMPERVEDYEVLGLIGTGSFGTCYKVRKKNTQHVFVWKAVDYGSMSEERKKFLVSEVNVLRELRHPNIVRYYDRILHKESATIYIIMEWCEGGDLASLINKCRRTHTYMDEAFVWRTLYQTSRALQACHSPGRPVLHRDIKPANLFLDSQFNIKLGDFGLARVISSADVQKDNADDLYAETVVGTPFYMSPEVVKGNRYNRKSDVWSLGCVIYELCSLQPPFSCNNVKVLAQRIKDGRIPSHYSEELHNIIVFMLTADHEVRPSIETILHHPSVVTHIAHWSLSKPICSNLSNTVASNKPANFKEPLDETFCSCANDCCGDESSPVYAEIGNPNHEDTTSQKHAQNPLLSTANAPKLSQPVDEATVHHLSKSKSATKTVGDSGDAVQPTERQQESDSQVDRDKLILAERVEILREREAQVRMRELTLDERERTVRKKEKEAALASRLARETMGRACVYLKTCRNGRGSAASTVTKVTMRSRSPSEKAPSLPDADSSLDQEHGETSTIAKTSTKLDPRTVCRPSWSMARKVTFNLKDAPQLIDGLSQDPTIMDNTKNAGILSAVNGKANNNARQGSWSDNYYWLESKKQAYRESHSGKENKIPDVQKVNKKPLKKNPLMSHSGTLPASFRLQSKLL